MMISGKGPSPALAGGNAMLTSMGVPSKLGAVLRGALLPHSRTWSVALMLQVIPRALGIAACALDAANSDPRTTDTSTSFRIPLLPLLSLGASLGAPRASP